MTIGTGAGRWRSHRDLGRSAFMQKFPHPFLVCLDWEAATEEPDDDTDVVAFQTATVSSEALAKLRAPDLSRALVAPVVKTERNPYQLIYLGRAANCDIVLAHHSVSKLHACLDVRGPGQAEVTDVGSRNGTLVRGLRLGKKQSASLRSGEEVLVGRIPLQFLDAGGLFDLL